MSVEPTSLAGRSITVASGDYSASITTVGASLRALQHRGRDLVVPFAPDRLRPVYRGAILAPWPNRVVDGRYTYGGHEQQLALSEPDRGHALHGLVVWTDFAVVSVSDDTVELTTSIVAQTGYPHPVRVDVRYELTAAGLVTTVTGTNLGTTPAPWGTGPHPYLVAGRGLVDDWQLRLPARQVLTVTPDRLVPTGLAAVAEHDFDFTLGRAIGETFIDHAFTGLVAGSDGEARVEVRTAAGDGVAMSWDDRCPWVQIHTADRPDPAEHRVGLAVEPMTCAPDAFNSGLGLVDLEPGESSSATWRIEALPPVRSPPLDDDRDVEAGS